MPTKHTATLPDGRIVKRTSQNRVYPYMVAGRRCAKYAMEMANSKLAQKQDGENWDWEKSRADGTYEYSAYIASSPRIEEYKARDLAEGGKFIAEHPDRAAYVAEKHAARVAAVEATDFSKWFALGWCGRHDLAMKLAGSKTGRSYWAETRIIETQHVTK